MIARRLLFGVSLSVLLYVAHAEDGTRVSIQPRPAKPAAGAEESRAANIKVITEMVQINVTVTTPLNQVVTGMEKEHFRLFEDKVEQTLASFTQEEAPLSIGLVFDISGSMGAKLSKSREAAAQFFKTANPKDEFFLVQFNDRPEVVVPMTTNTEEIQNRMAFTQAKGRTALLDGLYLAMNHMKKEARNPRKAILILSDGGDNSSRYTESEIKNMVREADVQVYAMGIFEGAGRGRTPEEALGPGLLSQLAEDTGGRHFPIDNIRELPDVAAKIGIELRSQYIIGYSPSNPQRDGKYRRVEVKLVQPRGLPPLRAYYRTGYYAPTQ